jgi:hypothetical protein
MTKRSLQVAALFFVATLPAVLPAQETTGMEEERMKALTARNAEQEQWFGPRNKISIGFRFLTSGGHVDFGNLGAVPAKFIAPASAGATTRVYDNGYVDQDGLRNNEVDSTGKQTSTPGGRYITYVANSDGTKGEQNGEFLSYTPGQSRIWLETTEEQLTAKPGYVGFTTYSTTSEGGHFTDKPGGSAGVELQFSRDLGRLSRRIQWGFTTGIALNGINSKTAGQVTSTLNSRTDYYAIVGGVDLTGRGAGISAPTFTDYTNPNSNVIYVSSFETTIPVADTPGSTESHSVAGGAVVNGNWQVRGAYFMMKVGPSFRTQFNDRLELSGSAGFAGAYAGTTYTAIETFNVNGLLSTQTAGDQTPQSSSASKFLMGYYADLTLEWAANENTGLFGGVTAQQLADYTQTVAARTAHIDLGSTVGVRGGISIKF